MDNRFLPSSYKQEHYLKITSFSPRKLKVEECNREFEQFQIKFRLNEEFEVIITRFNDGSMS